jgi:hypothetical protein
VGGNEVDLQGNSAALSRRDCAVVSRFIRVANRLFIVDARLQIAEWQRLSNAFTRVRECRAFTAKCQFNSENAVKKIEFRQSN